MAQTPQRSLITQYSDGQVVISKIRKKRNTIPIFGANEEYSATLVTSWYDGSPMDDTKADGSVYFKLKALPQGADPDIYGQYIGSYFRVNLPKFGETFLEKDTMAQMRALSAVEILLLKMGYYKGVKLNGYYEKNDTPNPVEYYISNTADVDDGGSVIVVGDIKLEHDFKDYIHVSYFGALGDGAFNNTSIYNNIIQKSQDGGIVEFPKSGKYLGHFNSNKPLRLYGNGVLLSNYDDTSTILKLAQTVLLDYTTVPSGQNLKYGDIKIPLTTVSGISKGDIITVYDQKLRPANNQKINYESFTVLSVDEINNVVEIDSMVRSSQNVHPINVCLVQNPLIDIQVEGFNIIPSNTHTGRSLRIEGSKRTRISKIKTENTVGEACSDAYCVGTAYTEITHKDARLADGGQGYGTISYFSRDISVEDLQSDNMRHSVDFSSCYTVRLKKIRDYNSFSPMSLAHNTFGGDFEAEDIIVDGQSQASFIVNGQGLTVWGDHVLRDVRITNVTHIWRTPTTNPRGIYLQSSYDNVYIENVRVINKIEGYVMSNANSAVIGLNRGSLQGDVTIKNIYADKVASLVQHTTGTESVNNVGMLTIDGAKADECFYLLIPQNTKRLTVKNISAPSALGNPSNSLMLTSATALEELNFEGSIVKNTTTVPLAVLPNNMLKGSPLVSKELNGTVLPTFTSFRILDSYLYSRNFIQLQRTETTNLILTTNVFLPNPKWYGETFTIMVNNFSDFGVLGSISVPSTNTNIINPEGGYGIILRSGEPVKFTGVEVNGAKVWMTERINKQASGDVKGLVNRASPLANISQADLGTAPNTDVETLATWINTNLNPLVNALKTSQNTELANQRTAGQQNV